jgi:hypothetical protein
MVSKRDYYIDNYMFQFLLKNRPFEVFDVGQKLFEKPDFDGIQNLQPFRPKSEPASADDGLEAGMNIFY